jgi:hypothetical protein
LLNGIDFPDPYHQKLQQTQGVQPLMKSCHFTDISDYSSFPAV